MTKYTNLAEAFVAAQAVMESPKRTAINPHFNSRFAPLEECVRVSVPVLNAHGIALIQPCVSQDDGRMSVSTILMGYGETLDLGTLLFTPPNDPQKIGTWLTYLRRYGLTSGLALAADDDDDGNEASKTAAEASKTAAKPKAEPKPDTGSSEAQQRKIHIEAKEAGITDAKLGEMLHTRFGVTSTKDLTKAQASRVIEGLVDKRAKESVENLDEKMAELGLYPVQESPEEVPF